MAILLSKMDQGQIQFAIQCHGIYLSKYQINIRELEGVLIRIIAESSLNFKKIDIELAKEVVQNHVNQVNQELTVESIAKIVCEQYKIGRTVGRQKSAKANCDGETNGNTYFTKQYTQKLLKQIGEYFGGKDHATVLYSLQYGKIFN